MILPAREHLAATSPDDPAPFYYQFGLRYPYRKRLSMALKLLGSRRFGRLLEIGYGSGVFFPELARRCGLLVGVDLHRRAPLVRRMMEREEVRGSLGVAGVNGLPFTAGSFDAVVCLSVLEFVEDVAGAVGEIRRVLRPGGLAILGAPVLNRITGLAYERLIGHIRHGQQHKADHRRILGAAAESLQALRVERFPRFLPIDCAFFFCVACQRPGADG